ncbi:MAG: glycosyltransferase [Planctomycetes bacterium]|nr:glycosyltransferase [Planctomycetota bacterium]
MSEAPTILFAGGGTGGHLFPGLAIAECVLEERPAANARFLCSERPGDAEMLRAERLGNKPVEFVPIPAQPFSLRPKPMMKFLSHWGKAVRAARAEITAARASGNPVIVVAMGGFVAAPVVQAARVEKCPVVMVNLDATPGRANGWIASHAVKVLTAAAVEGRPWEVIPPIVRRAAHAPGSAAECRRRLGMEPDRPTLFVTGASLGARSINQFLMAFVEAHAQDLRDGGWQVIHQTGKSDTEELRAVYNSARIAACVQPFFREMGVAWGAADLAVSRAGAGSVAEAWCNRVPTVFLPYPFHSDQHQKRNAQPLVAAGAAVMATDEVDPGANMRSAAPVVLALLQDRDRRNAISGALHALGPTDGARRAARVVLQIR